MQGEVKTALYPLSTVLLERELGGWGALARVADPEAVRPAVDTLGKLLTDDDKDAREDAAKALKDVAKEYPVDVSPAIEDLKSTLNDDCTGESGFS